MSDMKGGSIVPKAQPEDKKAQGFSQTGIPTKSNDQFQEGLAKDKMSSSRTGKTGPQNARE